MANLLVPRQLVNLSTKKSANGLYKLISNTYLYIYTKQEFNVHQTRTLHTIGPDGLRHGLSVVFN